MEIYRNNEEWKIAIVRLCYITFQVASSYFVFFIVLLRLIIIYNPMMVMNLETRTAKICTRAIWGLAFLLNLLPVLCSIGYHEKTKSRTYTDWRRDGIYISYDTKDALMISYMIVANVGIALPLFLTIIAYIVTTIVLKNKKQNKETGKESSNTETFRKLINGLVIWLIVCNAPYIVWHNWVLFVYLNGGTLWNNVAGVIITWNITFKS